MNCLCVGVKSPASAEAPSLISKRARDDKFFDFADCLKQIATAHIDDVKPMASCFNRASELSVSRRVGVAVRNSLVFIWVCAICADQNEKSLQRVGIMFPGKRSKTNGKMRATPMSRRNGITLLMGLWYFCRYL